MAKNAESQAQSSMMKKMEIIGIKGIEVEPLKVIARE